MKRSNSQRIAEEINTRRSFTKEFKFKVVQFFYDHVKNCNQTVKNFKVDRKQVGVLFIEIPTFIILLRLRETHNALQLPVFFFSFFSFSFFCQRYPEYRGIRSKRLFYRPPKS